MFISSFASDELHPTNILIANNNDIIKANNFTLFFLPFFLAIDNCYIFSSQFCLDLAS